MTHTETVTMVRVYLNEGQSKLDSIMQMLHDEEHMSGVTVLRGIIGYGDSGRVHTSSLLDVSLDLPLIVEFFDTQERVEPVISRLEKELSLAHIVTWNCTNHHL
jgi:PII-like signaling protein